MKRNRGCAAGDPPFRLTSPKVLESDLQAQIIDYLRAEQARGRVAWFCRVNGGLAGYGKFKVKNYVLHLLGRKPAGKGYADLHGMLDGGKYFALEVKRPGEKATDEQLAFLQAVRDNGGVGAVVFGFEDVPSVLFGDINPERNSETKTPLVGMEPSEAGSLRPWQRANH